MKDFVPYNEALKLKELGFDEPCFGLYKEDSSFLYADVFSFREPYSPSEFKEGVDEGVCYINSEILEELVTAPTFSQAFRWFREKYKMIHQIYSLKYKGGVNYDYEIFSLVLPTDDELGDEDDVATDKSMETYDSLVDKNFKHDESETYEDAELACLQKLIEIVNKNI
jgi:hypothetical protein